MSPSTMRMIFLKTKIKYPDIVGLKVMIYYLNVYSENPFLK